jgi:hypothetical protein
MAIDWNELDKQIGIDTIIEEEAKGGDDSGEYREVPKGNYDVAVAKMEIGQSKTGNPKAVIWFKILAGQYKGSIIFMNQAITMRFHFGKVNKILKALESGIPDEEIKIMPLKKYNDLMMDIFEAIDGKFEYGLAYGEDAKGYQTYEIKEVYGVGE